MNRVFACGMIALCLSAGTPGLAAPTGAASSMPSKAVAVPAASASGSPVGEVRYVRAMRAGKAAFDRGDFEAAQAAFKQALSLRRDSAQALDDLGEAQYRAGRLGDAQQSFQKAIDTHDPRVRARAAYHLGNTLYQQKKLPEAAEAYKRALRWNEGDDDARHNLQVVLDQMKSQQNQNKNDQKQAGKDSKPQQNANKNDQKQAGKESKPQQNADKNDQKQAGSGATAQQKPATPSTPQRSANAQPASPPKPRPGARPSASAQPAQAAQKGMTADDAARILQYYSERERQARAKSTPASPYRPPSGAETW